MKDVSDVLSAMAALGWLLLVVVLIFSYRQQIRDFLMGAVAALNRGSEIKVGFLTIGQAVGELKPPPAEGALTDDHLALIHRSWRAPERDAEFHGQKMYRIHVIVFGTMEALRRVDYVIYRLDKAYPKPVQVGGALETCFELKELANGYSLLRAEVYVRDQKEPVRLSRFIDLVDQSPPLKGVYQRLFGNTK
jgi:hypothetical protein